MKARGNVSLLLYGEGALVTESLEDIKALNAFFTSVFTSKSSFQWAPEVRWKVLSEEDIPTDEDGWVGK